MFKAIKENVSSYIVYLGWRIPEITRGLWRKAKFRCSMIRMRLHGNRLLTVEEMRTRHKPQVTRVELSYLDGFPNPIGKRTYYK